MFEPPAEFRLPPNASPARCEEWYWQMARWLAQEINRREHEAIANIEGIEIRRINLTPLESAKRAATRDNNLKPLCRLYPEIADFICRPKGSPGRPRTDPATDFTPAKMAAHLVPHIRDLWQRKYGQKKRNKNESIRTVGGRTEVTASAFAAAIYGEWNGYRLTANDVERARHKSGKHKQPRRKTARQ
jgi:hypothetical protein